MEITFLGEHYTLPSDIVSYKNYHHKFELLRQELLAFMLKHYGKIKKWPDKDIAEDKFREIANRSVGWLFQEGIYDKTVDDFIVDNAGYIHYKEALKQTCLKHIEIATAQVKGIQSAMITAEKEAASNITGMGFNIYTSSIIELGVWAAMESSTLKKQAAEADAQYNRMMSYAVDEEEDKYKKAEKNLNKNFWLPKMKESVDLYVAILFEKYIQALIDAGKFDCDALNYIDYSRATMMIENISNAANKQQLIQSAFLKCPFCLAVYMEAVNLYGYTRDILEVAKIFGLSDGMCKEIKQQIFNLCRNQSTPESLLLPQILPYAELLAEINEIKVEDVVDQSLSTRRNKNLFELNRLEDMTYDSPEFDDFIRKTISKKVEKIVKFYVTENDKFTARIKSYVYSEVLRADDSIVYLEAKERAVSSLLSNSRSYIMEAVRRKKQWEEAVTSYKKHNQYVNNQISELSIQRNKAGIFGFSKKKVIDDRIVQLQAEDIEVKKEIDQARKKYITMFSKKIILED